VASYSELKPAVIIPLHAKYVNSHWDIHPENEKISLFCS